MRTKNTVTRGLLAICLTSLLSTVVQAKTEYMYFTMRGTEMMPSLRDGDTVKVRACTNGTLIKSGSLTEPNSGDIIVYCAGAVMPSPSSMFTIGRVVSKHFNGEYWCFKTKMDNLTEPDSWTVPEYALLGIVEGMADHAGSSGVPSTQEASSQNEQQAHETNSVSSPPDMSHLIKLTEGIAVGLVLGFTGKRFFARLAHSPRWSMKAGFKKQSNPNVQDNLW